MTSDLTSFAARLREIIAGTFPCSSRREEAHDASCGSWSLLTSAATDEVFNRLALELFALQFHANPPYRRICEARGATPATVEHWSRIPAVPAAAFKEHELTCLPPENRTTVFYSSGTTGQQPSRHFHDALSLALYEASLWPWFCQHVPAPVERATGKSPAPADRKVCPAPGRGWQLAILTPPPGAAPNSSLVHMFEIVRQKAGACVADCFGGVGPDGGWTLDCVGVEVMIRHSVESGQPLVLLGTAFNFVHLLDDFTARGVHVKLPAGSRVMETGGYKGRSRELPKAELHELIMARLGVPRLNIICEYGMSELGSQAYDSGGLLDTGAEGRAGSPLPGVDWHANGAHGVTRPTLSFMDGVPERLADETRNFHFPPWCRTQIISPETGLEVREGETGVLRIFDLANAFSVSAVQTDDLAVRRGDGFELIGRVVAAEPRGCSLLATEARKS